MKCRFCHEEFNEKRFSRCPFCLSIYEDTGLISNRIDEVVHASNIADSNIDDNEELITNDIECYKEKTLIRKRVKDEVSVIDKILQLSSVAKQEKLFIRISECEFFLPHSKMILMLNNVYTVEELIYLLKNRAVGFGIKNIDKYTIDDILTSLVWLFSSVEYEESLKSIDEIVFTLNGHAYKITDVKPCILKQRLKLISGFTEKSIKILKQYNINNVEELLIFLSEYNLAIDLKNVNKIICDNIVDVIENYINNPESDNSDYNHEDIPNKREDEKNINSYIDITLISEAEKNISIDLIDEFKTRSKNVLNKNGITTIGKLCEFVIKHDLKHDLRNVGADTERNILDTLNEFLNGNISVKNNEAVTLEDTVMYNGINISSIPVEKLDASIFHIPELSQNIIKKLLKHKVKTVKDLIEYINKHDLKSELKSIGYVKEQNIKNSICGFLDDNYVFSAKDTLKKILNDNLKTDNGIIFLRRVNGETLEEIAQHPEGGGKSVTRETIRQKQSKFLSLIKPSLLYIVNEIKGERHYIYLNELNNLFDNDAYNRIVKYALSIIKDRYDYLEFADACIETDYYTNCEECINEFIKNSIGEYVNVTESEDSIIDGLHDYGIDFITIDAFKNALQENGYTINGDAAFKKTGYAKMCARIVKTYFPNGIRIPARHTNGDETDMEKIRKILFDEYGVKLESDNETVGAQIRNQLILCGESRYISPDNVQCDKELLYEIRNYINESKETKFFDKSIFEKFSGKLNYLSNIDNPYFLHGVLLYYFGDEFQGSRYYLRKRNVENHDASAADYREEQIYQYICGVNRPVTRAELKSKYKSWSDAMIAISLQDSSRITPWEWNAFYSVELLNIKDKDVEKLRNILIEQISQYDGYTNSYLVFESLKTCDDDFFVRYPVIKNEKNLFYLLAYLFNHVCDFRLPHIALKDKFISVDANSLVDYLLGYPNSIKFSEYLFMCQRFRWPESQIRSVFKQYQGLFFQISNDVYIRKKYFVLQQNVLKEINDVIINLMHDGILFLGSDIDFSIFPKVDYEWNGFLLRSIINEYLSNKYRIIDSTFTDMRYLRCAVVMKNSGFSSIDQIIAFKLKCDGKSTASTSTLISILRMNGLTDNTIPIQFKTSKYWGYNKREQVYYLVE